MKIEYAEGGSNVVLATDMQDGDLGVDIQCEGAYLLKLDGNDGWLSMTDAGDLNYLAEDQVSGTVRLLDATLVLKERT